MPPKKVKLHVSSNNKTNGVLRVSVNPWRVHLDPDDVVQWELDIPGAGDPKNDIAWFRVEQIDRVNLWPFQGNPPPDPKYTGNGGSSVTSNPRNNAANKVGDVIAYGLTVGFKDDSGSQRTLYIDPDMVVDS